MRTRLLALMLSLLVLVPVGRLVAQSPHSSWSVAVRGLGLFPADRSPADGGLGAEIAAGLRLGKHTALVIGGHAGRYNVVGSSLDLFYNPDNDSLEDTCPTPCGLIPVTRQLRDEHSLTAVTLSFRVTPLTGRAARPWFEVGAGPYRLSETSTDRGIRRDGSGTVFDFRRDDRAWGAGAHGGLGVDWFPQEGRVGISASARLHGGIATPRGDLAFAAALAGGVGVVLR